MLALDTSGHGGYRGTRVRKHRITHEKEIIQLLIAYRHQTALIRRTVIDTNAHICSDKSGPT